MLDSWHTFYSTAGESCAGLIGLLFVGLSIHLDVVVSRHDVRASARGAFQSLIAILVVSLLALVPDVDYQALGWTLVGLGGAGLFFAALEARRMLGADLLLGATRATRRLGLRFAGLALLLTDGTLFLSGDSGAPLWLMATVFVLLGSSAQTAWTLLIDVARMTRPAAARNPGPTQPEAAAETDAP